MFTKPTVSSYTYVERNAAGERARIETGFVVSMMYRPGHDEMFELLTHPAVFRTEERAQRFADKIDRARGDVKVRNWSYDGGICSPIGSNRLPFYSVL
jgi:hypothetical protein